MDMSQMKHTLGMNVNCSNFVLKSSPKLTAQKTMCALLLEVGHWRQSGEICTKFSVRYQEEVSEKT